MSGYNSSMIQSANMRGHSAKVHTHRFNPVFPTVSVPGTDIYLSAASAVNLPMHKINTELVPDSGDPSQALSAGSKVTFRIPKAQVQAANGITLELEVANNTGAATTLCDAYHLIDRIILFGPGGSKELQYIEGDALYINTMFLKQTKWNSYARLANTTSAWGNGAAIGNGARVKYYVKILGNIWSTSQQILSTVDGDLRVEVRFHPFTRTNAAAGAAPTLASATLIIDDYRMDAGVRQEIEARPIRDGRFLDIVPQKFTETLAASTQYKLRLTGLHGLASMLVFFIRSTAAVGNSLKTFQAVDTFEFEDATGKNLIGGNPQDSDFNRFHEIPELFETEFAINHPVYLISASTDPVADLEYGQLNGWMPLSGNEMLTFTTPSTLVGGSYDIVVYAYVASTIKNRKGVLEIQHS